ncbi:hypothetical protein WG31_01950 [Acetobacter oryzifermentans]|uniref:Uncharacterized protein n=1 Tax=Acetobacter oryzifermentans TaxID=1633874 RepID=A0ABN4NTF5_9PROT|nr:hypothetical protein WG31_01950 [Acetobacter oryzifermentans]
MSLAHELAMGKAIELHKGTGVSADDLAATAETIRRYCAGELYGKTSPCSFPPKGFKMDDVGRLVPED